jgi:hypothetical protein
MIDIVEVLTHWYAGRSQNELATSLGVDRKTLGKYTGPARAAGIEPGGPPMAEADWRTLATGWCWCLGGRSRSRPDRLAVPHYVRLDIGCAGCGEAAPQVSRMFSPTTGSVASTMGRDLSEPRGGVFVVSLLRAEL